MAAYYNENDKFAAAWLRELIAAKLIADGEVDERSIAYVQPDDVRGFTQCHFFAGIGGWSYALRLAGWPDDRPVWTGSCPCQPFSSASNGRNQRLDDSRNLWPSLAGLIAANTPRDFLGEQVAQAGDWFAGVCDDMEAMGYEVGAAILQAVAVGHDHARSRVYFAGHADRYRQPVVSGHDAQVDRLSRTRGVPAVVVPAHGLPARVAYRGFGNAIVPQVAQAFIESYLEVIA